MYPIEEQLWHSHRTVLVLGNVTQVAWLLPDSRRHSSSWSKTPCHDADIDQPIPTVSIGLTITPISTKMHFGDGFKGISGQRKSPEVLILGGLSLERANRIEPSTFSLGS